MPTMTMKTLNVLLLVCGISLCQPQQPVKAPLSDQEILTVLGRQPRPNLSPAESVPVPVPSPEQHSTEQNTMSAPSLNVEPLPPHHQLVSGAQVISSFQSACHALSMFIFRSEQMQRYTSLMPPGLMPWIYAMNLGFPVDCEFSSYSNALNMLSTACSVFDRCPVPSPLMDVDAILTNISAGHQMASQFQGGLGSTGVRIPSFVPQFQQQQFQVRQMSIPPVQDRFVAFQLPDAIPAPAVTPVDQQVLSDRAPVTPVPPQPLPVKPLTSMLPVPSEPIPVEPRLLNKPVRRPPGIRTRGRKVQVQAQQITIPKTPTVLPGEQQSRPRVQVITKLVPVPPPQPSLPKPVAIPQPRPPQPSLPKPVAIPQPRRTPQQTFQRMPVPSMGTFYPMWFYRFHPPAVNVGRSARPTTSPRPRHSDHDHSD